MKLIIDRIGSFWKNPSHLWLKNIILFTVLLFGGHYIYLYWIGIEFYPFKTQVYQLFDWSSALVFKQSVWVLDHIFRIEFDTIRQTIWLTSNNGNPAYVEVSPECTTLKQWFHWLFIMLLFPGPWKQKLWYIPLGLIVIHFVNVFRIVFLALTLIPWPAQFDFFHNYIIKTFFYFIIFMMWVVWVEYIASKKSSKKHIDQK